ncbi:MAG: TonB-dependent receptor plug domain-containing protein, partial [Steroidobacteraceae bacterium]|nr:TonB-dependent receptor plug domain-containing protein [Steroidobacteraceae bacterium]
NVAIFYGGVYLASTSAANLEIIDVARIEVVRGPQSALYGRNAFNGAINFVPAAPTEQFFARAEGTVGTDERYEGKLILSGPFTDKLRGRLAVSYNTFDGTYRNRFKPNDNIGGFETKNASGMIDFDATEALSLRLFGLYTDDHRDPSALYFYSANNCGPPGLPLTAVCGEYAYRDDIVQHPAAKGFTREVALGAFDISYKLDSGTRAGELKLISQSALYDSKTQNFTQYDANGVGTPFTRILLADVARLSTDPGVIARAAAARVSPAQQAYREAPPVAGNPTVLVPIFVGSSPINTRAFSQELRVETDPERRLRAALGVFYYKNEYDNKAGLAFSAENLRTGETFRDLANFGFLFSSAISNDPRNSVLDTTNGLRVDYQKAYFGSWEFDVFDNLTIGGELRHDTEDRQQFSRANPAASFQRREFKYNTWRYHVDWGWGERQRFYISAAKGLISGHFNNTFDALANQPVPPALQAYDPAENRTYELGWKAEWLERRLATEVALFHITYDGLQVNA